MVYEVFSVKDAALDLFLPPFFMRTKGEALRALMDTARDPNHAFYKHPSDYSLYHLGHFQESNAEFVTLDIPELVIRVVEFGVDHEEAR